MRTVDNRSKTLIGSLESHNASRASRFSNKVFQMRPESSGESREVGHNTHHTPATYSTDPKSRAYLAASRRTDRGLNARMQSARRASEIHQKRTGKALRVTEALVLNEALYEEITDISTQRRRWRAHLQTQSEDFDRSLLAYMTGRIATHDALSQAVAETWLEEQRDAAAGFVSPAAALHDVYQPHQAMVDRPTNTPQHTPHVLGYWDPQQGDYTHQVPLPAPKEITTNQQSMSPPNLAWLAVSRRTSLPTNFAPQTLHQQSPSWTPTPFSDRYPPTSPIQRVDSTVDHTRTPITKQNPPQTAPHHQSPKPTTINNNNNNTTNNTPPSSLHPLAQPPGHHHHQPPRYTYNPNGKPKPSPNSSISIQSPNAHLHPPHTPRSSVSFPGIYTPASSVDGSFGSSQQVHDSIRAIVRNFPTRSF